MSKPRIPKIIHQMWIGPHEMPKDMIQTWIDKNPDWEHILWTEEEIKKRLPEEEQETSQPETFKEMPKIGDIVRIGKEYGEVMVADEATRNIEITPLSKEDALKMVKDDN